MIGKMQLKALYEDRKPRAFVQTLREQLGLPANRFDYHRDPVTGQPFLRNPQMRPHEVSLRGLFEACCGESALDRLDPGRGMSVDGLLEAGPGPGVDPTAFLNISAFNAAVSGLIEVRILESYRQPEYIGDQIAETVPTRLNGQKHIGITAIGDKAKTRKPGMPHEPAGVGERYVETPETSERALKLECLQETVFFDLTGEFLQTAGAVGESLGYDDELQCIDSFIGASAATYKYLGTTYNTYQTSVGTVGGNYKNEYVNPLNDYTSIDNALLKFVDLTDPHTDLPIMVTPKVVVSVPHMESRLSVIQKASQVMLVDNQANSGTIRNVSDLPARVKSAFGNPVISTLLYYRMVASASAARPGLGYSTAKAGGTWFVGDPKRGHKRMENWPLRVRQATATEYQMLDRGVIAAYFADYRNVYAWTDPRYTQKNTPT